MTASIPLAEVDPPRLHTAAAVARNLANTLAADGDPPAAALYDDQLTEAVQAARRCGTPLAWIVQALQREADARGWC